MMLCRVSMLAAVTLVTSSCPAADSIVRFGFETLACASTTELEPNDTILQSNPVLIDPAMRSALICGVNFFDTDVFQFTIDSTATVVLEAIRTDGAPCNELTSMAVTLLDDSGLNTIAEDTGGGAGGCGSLDGTLLPALQNLAPGFYYARVSVAQVGPEDVNFRYALRFDLR